MLQRAWLLRSGNWQAGEHGICQPDSVAVPQIQKLSGKIVKQLKTPIFPL